MSRALVTIRRDADRTLIQSWAAKAPFGTRVEFKLTKRSLPQNSLMWAMLTDVARQLPWHGKKLTPDDWKIIFLDALTREHKMIPNIDGTGFVDLHQSSSDLTKEEMSNLIDLIGEFGARHDVKFNDSTCERA